MTVFCIGDIHGRFEALKQVLKSSGFRKGVDTLVCLGDVCDGGAQTKECVDELLKIKNLVFIRGNHDQFLIDHLSTGWSGELWLQQGGANTLKSYGAKVKLTRRMDGTSLIDTSNMIVPASHQDFFNRAVPYYVWNNKLFVHGGFDPTRPIQKQTTEFLMWDRDLIRLVKHGLVIKDYKEVFVGHTTTQIIMNDVEWTKPLVYSQLICLDTGAGWSGKLTLMDVEAKQYWQSDTQRPPV